MIISAHLLGVDPLVDANFPRHLDTLGLLHQPGHQHGLHGALLHGLQVALLAWGGDQHAASLVLANLEKGNCLFNLPR